MVQVVESLGQTRGVVQSEEDLVRAVLGQQVDEARILTPVYWEGEERQAHGELHMHDLNGVDGSNGKGGGLLVLVVQLVESFVQPRRVVEPVEDVRSVVLRQKVDEVTIIIYSNKRLWVDKTENYT